MAVKDGVLDDATKEQIRAEVRGMFREFAAEMREIKDAARALSRDLFSIDAHGAQLEAAGRQANEALTIAASLRHEWLEAKVLARMFEQREFLGLPQVRAVREHLLDKIGLQRIGAGDPPMLAYENKKLAEENERLHAQLAAVADQLRAAETKANDAIKALPAGAPSGDGGA